MQVLTSQIKGDQLPISKNKKKQIPILYANTAKYQELTFEAKLRWKAHIKKKRAWIQIKKMYWLLGKIHSVITQQITYV